MIFAQLYYLTQIGINDFCPSPTSQICWGLNCLDFLPIASPNLPLLQLVGDRLNRLDFSTGYKSLHLFMVDNGCVDLIGLLGL
jgi:hypothetical protein